MIEYRNHTMWGLTATMPERADAWQPVPQLMTQDELVRFLRIPEISAAKDQHNVTEHLKRYRDLQLVQRRHEGIRCNEACRPR